MNQKRLDMVEAAFKKMDKSGDGFITVVDLKGTYDVRYCMHSTIAIDTHC